MNEIDFVAELRKRIHPVHAKIIGTESYERRRCAEVIESLLAERDVLRAELATKDARIAELEKDNAITHENLSWYMARHAENLATLVPIRIKCEPVMLSDDDIEDMRVRYANVITCGHNESDDYIEFARLVEQAVLKANGLIKGEG